MNDERLTRNLKYAALAIALLALGAALYLFLARIKLVVIILIGATFFAYLIFPAVAWLQRRRLPRWAAITTVYLAIGLVVGGALAFAGPAVTDQARNLTQDFPNLVTQTKDAIVGSNAGLLDAVPLEARQTAANALDDIVKQAESAIGAFAGQAVRLAASLAGFITGLILVPLLTFYVLLDFDRIKLASTGLLPPRHRESVLGLLGDIDAVIAGFVRGQLIVAAIVGALVTIILLLFRIKYALLIGAFAGAADMVPYVGAVAGVIPGVILAIFEHGPLTAVGLVAAFAVMYELEGHIIAPAVVGQRVGLTPLMVIVAILIGAELGGVGGMFLSVPVAGIVKVLVKRYARSEAASTIALPTEPIIPTRPDEPGATQAASGDVLVDR